MNLAKKNINNKALSLYSFRQPNIVIVGDVSIKKRLPNIEKNFNVEIIFSDSADVRKKINNSTVAVIVDEKKVKSKITNYVENLVNEFALPPIFYLSREPKKSSFFTSLYNKGVQGVVDWPQESQVLLNVVVESMKSHENILGKNKGDRNLAKIIKAHLMLESGLKNIKIVVIDGYVLLKGSVKSLYEKNILTGETSKILGVKKVIDNEIKIRNFDEVTDKELERRIKLYMGNILGDEKRSLSVKVKDKVVRLMGATRDCRSIVDIEKFAMKQAGVKEVVRQVKVKPSLASKRSEKARLLERKIKKIFKGVRHISIRLFGEYVEVSGVVKVGGDRNLIEKYLLQVLPVKKVINKLYAT